MKTRTGLFSTICAALVGVQVCAADQYAFDKNIGNTGNGAGQFNGPYGMALDQSGNLYVTDSGNNRIEEFDSSGTYLRQFGNGLFHQPDGIGVDQSGNVFAVDVYHNRVLEFNSQGIDVGQFGGAGSGSGQLSNPSGLAVDPSGNVFVLDAGNNRVVEFSNSGVYLNQFSHGFNYPEGLAIGPSGNVYVADTYNNRLVAMSNQGTYLGEIDGLGSPSSQTFPQGVAVDKFGNIFISETDGTQGFVDRILKYSPTLSFVTQFGSPGSGDGQLEYPLGLVVDKSGKVFVADANNDRIVVYSPVPEPSTFVLGFAGLAGLSLFSLWKRSRS